MPVYAYTAAEADARTARSGTVIADTPRQARELLRARGLVVEQVRARPASPSPSALARYLGRRQGPKLVTFVRDLATLLGVGVPLLEALETVAEQYRGSFHASVLQLRERVAAGASLAEAMREQPALFDELTVAMADVGEAAGALETVLEELAAFKERSSQLKGRIGGALLYPAIVLATGIGVSLFLMTAVVPNLLNTLVQNGRPLPWVTTVVKAASDFLLERWWVLLAGLALAASGTAAALRTRAGALLWHRSVLRLPVVGEMVRKQAVVRLAAVTATLLRGGVEFVPALRIARRSTRNLIIRDALERCEEAVSGGRDIADAARATGVFPAPVLRVLAVGQQSGRLEEMLDRLAADYDRHLQTLAARLTSLLEPVLILLLAVIVGFIAFATVLPILEAANGI